MEGQGWVARLKSPQLLRRGFPRGASELEPGGWKEEVTTAEKQEPALRPFGASRVEPEREDSTAGYRQTLSAPAQNGSSLHRVSVLELSGPQDSGKAVRRCWEPGKCSLVGVQGWSTGDGSGFRSQTKIQGRAAT